MKQVAAKSGADIEPIESQHVTLWAAKDIQADYLPDLKKLEKYFHAKCAEPIRSGLDKRSTHVVLLKDHAEYEAWLRTMFDSLGEQFGENGNPGAKAHLREEILKGPIFYSGDYCAISLGQVPPYWVHRDIVAGVGNMYFAQLATLRRAELGPLQTGFADEAEAAVFGSPSVMFAAVVYGAETRRSAGVGQDWSLLVRQRMATRKATPLGELLQMDHSRMLQPHYAEGWTLVGLLNKQPVKFGKLLLEIRKGRSDLEAIEKVYGWDEKELTKEWRAFVTGQGKKDVRSRD